MKHCVVGAGMPKKTFIKIFPGNETSKDWFEARKSFWSKTMSGGLIDIKVEEMNVERCSFKLKQVEEETFLNVAWY